MSTPADDARWLAAAAALADRGRPLSRPNPAVGAILVRDVRVVGRGWTRPGGRPHAEAVALAQADPEHARAATLYVTLEPCAHASARGPSCADLLVEARPARVVVACLDPDPRTAGQGMARLRDAGIPCDLVASPEAKASLAGFLTRIQRGRPHVTLKLATSLDGRIAMADGESRWITGEVARAHAHAERARADAILVGGQTLRTDQPRLDVRLPGLEARGPQRWVLTRGEAPAGWRAITSPHDLAALAPAQWLIVEGGAETAAAFLAADVVDRIMLYRAPVLIGRGCAALGDIGLATLAEAHDRWRLTDRRALAPDALEVYERTRPTE